MKTNFKQRPISAYNETVCDSVVLLAVTDLLPSMRELVRDSVSGAVCEGVSVSVCGDVYKVVAGTVKNSAFDIAYEKTF